MENQSYSKTYFKINNIFELTSGTCRTSCLGFHFASSLKGQCQEIFNFRFSSWIIFPQAPDDTIRPVSNFYKKFVEIFAAQDAPLVLLTPMANGKNVKS
jgi:hypothetical protein